MSAIRLVHLFPDLLNLYGDYANLLVLQRELISMGAEAVIERFAGEPDFDFSSAALVYAGPGTERRVGFALDRLMPFRDVLAQARANGAFFLFCGSAAELLAQDIRFSDGTARPGLGLAPYSVRRTEGRQTGDCLMESAWSDRPAVGFLNKSGYLTGVPAPLFDMKLGEGGILDENGAVMPKEGYAEESLLATYCIGPLLSKNPWLRSHVALRLFEKARPGVPPAAVEEDASHKAYEITAEALSRRIAP